MTGATMRMSVNGAVVRWRSRVALVAAALGLLAGIPGGALAAGGEYVVVQCHSLNRGDQATVADSSAYSVRRWCSDASHDYSIQINSVGPAARDGFGRARWSLSDRASLGMVGVAAEAKLRGDRGHRARLFVADARLRETARVGAGARGPTGFVRYAARVPRAHSFVARLSCGRSGGCARSGLAKAWVRKLRLTLRDYSDPVFVELDGTLLGTGWVRGTHHLNAFATDRGAGLKAIVASVNGSQLARRAGACPGAIPGTSLASRLVPCGSSGELRLHADTAQSPFRDGANSLAVCAIDFAGNRVCRWRTVQVDNTPPAAAFANAQDPDDPELIRAPVADPHSGVASGRIWLRHAGEASWLPLETRREAGELRARVDSATFPPGEYEFMAEAADVAGNRVETTLRADGDPMVLTFPLRAGVKLTAHLTPGGANLRTIPYGRDSEAAGRLLTAEGKPLAGQEVRVEERFRDGSLIDRRVRTVTTDDRGRWSSTLPAGPSRTVRALYAGTLRYLGDENRAGALRVRSKASFRISRTDVFEGRRVVFSGRVLHRGARIPAGGKLVELQVRERAGRWNTVREAFHTAADGRYRLAYRFGRFYRSDARFLFRLKVLREQDWPYKAPVRSRPRELIVKAR